MTRGGLVERNLATGEETRATQRGQDFNLKQEAHGHSPGAEPIHNAARPRGRPMEATRPLERETGARSHETPAGGGSDMGASRAAEGADSSASSNPAPASSKRKGGGQYTQQFAQEAASPGQPARLQFTEGEQQSAPQAPITDRKLEQAREKAGRVNDRLAEAREKIPHKKKLIRARTYDEQKNKVTHKLRFEEVPLAPGEKRFKPPAVIRAPVSLAKGAVKTAGRGMHAQFHRKMYEAGQDNAGVRAAHSAELAGEGVTRFGARSVRSVYRFHRNAPYRAAEKLEKQAVKANVKLSYRKALADNPKLKSNILSRFMQKRKIKRAYAKAARDAKRAGAAAKKTGSVIGSIAKAVTGFARRHPLIAGIVALILLLVFFLSSLLSSCSNMATGILSSVVGSSYTAADKDIDDAELSYTAWETDLQEQIANAETDYPSYDEYRYEVDDIGHDPFELMAYLTARYQDFTYTEVEADLRAIFAEQYALTFTPETETRYSDPSDADGDGDYGAYDWHILNVRLTAHSFTDLIAPSMDAGQREMHGVYMTTKGNRQYLSNVFAFNWLPMVTDNYGWRIHPISGERDYHMGLDIGVPTGTEILAGHDGRVTFAGFSGDYGNVVVIEDDKGLVSKYAHCDSVNVSAGQEVLKGGVIARSGSTGNSTGPHLHLEVIKNGRYLNPIYFAETGDDGSGRLPDGSPALPGSPGGPEYTDNPGLAMGDAIYDALIAEAEKHLGKRYVFGAKGPDTFDCSGFVCWSLTHSGIRSIRTNAQGLYNASTPVSPEDARPGDLLFFHSTYSTHNTVTHVAIYCGGNVMLHAGKPVQYTTFDTPYWREHFYSYGRIIN